MPCHKVMEFLSQKGIEFTEKNVSNDQDALKELVGMGFRATPVTLINGQKLVGFSPPKLEAALAEAAS